MCSLDYAEVYPKGVLAHVSIRMRGVHDRNRHERATRDIGAALQKSPLSGPRLVLKQPGFINAYATVLGFDERGGFWSLTYWFIHEPQPKDAQLHLTWAKVGIDVTFTVPAERMAAALESIESLREYPWRVQETESGP
ncbi:hypothetical protein J3A64_004816 [Pseudarthrobacter sp. PvP004]|uniref:hypothetical protein n=1 Tax=Pseudarthrobacter sp. PvP004 TaxID=2817850 RepID=UPI001AE17325|nr:hypothetical protein [Pseudarthrobacter sp. PvP004]MBP2269276.1 hypothetical protein [Pseudarthrobacter sp. PvP004]